MTMAPPIPESPSRQTPITSTGAHRGGLNLYQNDLDDEVSVLTSHTFGTIDSSSISVAAGVMRLSRMRKEVASKNSISHHSKEEYDHSHPTSATEQETSERDYDGDDDTISIAESILHNANDVLSRVSSSPYYTRRKKSLGNNILSDTDDDRHEGSISGGNKVESNLVPPADADDIIFDRDAQSEAYHCFQVGCLQDENAKPSHILSNQLETKKNFGDKSGQHGKFDNGGHNRDGGQRIQKLESETKKLQQLLKECQLETQRANQTLQTYRASHNRR